ncbi:MAG: pitrilysin family protein [Acidobacteriota bacterium]
MVLKRNKLFFLFFVILLWIFSSAQSQEENKYFIMKNGMKIFLQERHSLPLVNIVTAVNAGSKNENDNNNGLSHLLEHLILFRGTEYRTGQQIGEDIRRYGAYFNAHTGLDLTTFEISVPSEYIDFALKNQKEILFNLKLSEEEVENEKKIIIEEINDNLDDPKKYATSILFQELFKDHPYMNPAYGKKEIIENVNLEQIEQFYNKYFRSDNCAMTIIGDFNLSQVEEKVRGLFENVITEKSPSEKFEIAQLLKKDVQIEKEMDVNQCYLVVGMVGPDFNHPDQYAMDVLTRIIGSGFNPRLAEFLRGRNIILNSISMDYISNKYGGAIIIHITLEQKYLRRAIREIINFLKQAKEAKYSLQDYLPEEQMNVIDYLESAKNRIKLDFQHAQETALSIARAIAQFLILNEDESRGNYIENISKITTSGLRKVSDKYFNQGKFVIVSITPKKKE